MSETKHTPGPWETATKLLTNEGQSAVMARDAEGERVRIALVDARSEIRTRDLWKAACAEREANARLIAAAPNLLAACKEVLRCAALPESWAAPLRAAIRKATEG